MGASPSKETADSQHVFNATGPVRFSEGVVDSLQKSTDSDSTRAKTIELQIQQRVQEELQKLKKAAEDKLSAVSDKVSSEPPKTAPESQKQKDSSAQHVSWTEKPLLNRIGDSLFGSKESTAQKGRDASIDSSRVSKEINELKRKFEMRRQIVETDKDVSKAKEELVTCLRLNDRRPLDCWQEVENFKAGVARLEQAFVEKNGR